MGAHSVTHPRLPELPDERQAWEVRASLRAVAQHLGGPCRAFAHPYGLPPTGTAAMAALDGCLAFGTVKAPPVSWREVPWNIQRTCLPAAGRAPVEGIGFALAASPISLAVVVPARNRPVELGQCLGSIAAVPTPGLREIIVVDDASSQPVESICPWQCR